MAYFFLALDTPIAGTARTSWLAQVTPNARIPVRCRRRVGARRKKLSNIPVKSATNAAVVS